MIVAQLSRCDEQQERQVVIPTHLIYMGVQNGSGDQVHTCHPNLCPFATFQQSRLANGVGHMVCRCQSGVLISLPLSHFLSVHHPTQPPATIKLQPSGQLQKSVGNLQLEFVKPAHLEQLACSSTTEGSVCRLILPQLPNPS